MPDTSNQDLLKEFNQLSANLHRVVADQIQNALLNVHTILPAVVQSFDGNLVTAQPLLKRLFLNGVGWVKLPLCVDCPVSFPGGGGLFLTFPVQSGDECLLLFSERSINNWYQDGGIQIPAHYHTHDYSDAFALVGINSKPNKLANVQTDGAELRTRDRNTYIKMKPGAVEVKGDLTVTGNVTVTQDVTINTDVHAIALTTHKHLGVQTGAGVSGVPQ